MARTDGRRPDWEPGRPAESHAATVWLVLLDHEAEPDAVCETLADGFGIMDASVLVVEAKET